MKETVKAILITPSDIPRLVEVEPTLEVLNGLVGGYLEVLPLPGGAHAYVDDEGAIKADRPPPNAIASQIYGRPIFGPMVIFGTRNRRGERDGGDHDVPAAWARRLIPGGGE